MMKFLDLERRMRMHADEVASEVEKVTRSGWYVMGPRLESFEHEYAQYIGTRHCVGVGNGLDAITLIYRAYIEMGLLRPGDEVIVPANTYIASILAITENGLTPVLVEPDPATLQMDPCLIERHINSRTRSILMVHLYGRCAWAPLVDALCERHGLLLVEDNAQAHGCRCEKGTTGSLGHAAAHSFYPTKNLGAIGDAGAVTTDDGQLADMVRALRNYGSSRKYVFEYRGRNSRMDELQAAVLSVRLKYLDHDNRQRRLLARHYYRLLADSVVSLPAYTEENVWHLFPVFCDHRDALRQFLLDQGIETQVHYPLPPHRQQCYEQWNSLSLPVTERIHQTILSLPLGPERTVEEVNQVCEAIGRFKP